MPVTSLISSPSRALCPILSKSNTFQRFDLAELSANGNLGDVADVLTSSGHGGTFSFGVISREEAAAGAQFIDRALDAAFGIASRRTLTINCLPMGVGFASRRMTVATTSVREDMALALVERFGHHYEQIVLVGDPLFLKRLTDYSRDRGFDWTGYRVNVIVGEEIFGERFRGYLASCLGLNPDASGRRLHHVLVRRRRTRFAPVLRNDVDDRAAARDAHQPGVRARPCR